MEYNPTYFIESRNDKVINTGNLRGVGKTAHLISLAKEKGGTYVSIHLIGNKLARENGLDNAITLNERSSFRGLRSKLYVDEGVMTGLIRRFNRNQVTVEEFSMLLDASEKIAVNSYDSAAITGLYIRLSKDVERYEKIIEDLSRSSIELMIQHDYMVKMKEALVSVNNLKNKLNTIFNIAA